MLAIAYIDGMKNEGRFLEALGKHLKRLRVAKGKTQDDVALDIGVSRSYLSEIENGRSNPSVFIVKRILNYLGEKWSSLD
jgi:transcriptional regulator with XRE-family HTH domain